MVHTANAVGIPKLTLRTIRKKSENYAVKVHEE
jgi:hypothetical protein